MAHIFRTNLARAAAVAIKQHTGHEVEQRFIDGYVHLHSYPATLEKAVDYLSIPVGYLDDRDFREMVVLANNAFMAQGR